jgi:hypothetical protein
MMPAVLVSDQPAPEPAAPPAPQNQLAARLIGIALTTLTQKTVVAIASLFSLVLAGSVWWLAMAVATTPTTPQLITLGLYAAFVLALHWVRRK